MSSQTDRNPLIQKLDEFIRRYYYNRLLRGLIFFVAGGVSAFLLAAVLEYFGEFGTDVRKWLFFGFLGFSLFIFVRFVAIPLLSLYRIGPQIDYRTASGIIGSHFPEVSDKLLNTLQMNQMLESGENSSLLRASIEQRMEQLKPIPFVNAINLKENLRYLKYAAVPLILFLVVLFLAPGFTNSSKRLVNYNTYYEKKAPFYFELLNKELKTGQNEDFDVSMKLKGDVIPAEAFVMVNGNRFRMKTENGTFSYTLRNCQKATELQFWADGFYSEAFTLEVLPKPLLVKMKASLDYPAYTGLKDEEVLNSGDLSVPAGTVISWTLESRNTDEIEVVSSGKSEKAKKSKNGMFSFRKRFVESSPMRLLTRNKQSGYRDSVAYQIQVIPDAYPEISIEQEQDSMSTKVIYLYGSVKDDYGFSKLQFRYRYLSSPDSSKTAVGLQSIPVRVDKARLNQPFYFVWDLKELGIEPEDQLEYYFEVWDNDGVRGPKSSRTGLMTFSAPSKAQISKQSEQKADEVKQKLNDAEKQGQDMEKDLKELEKRLAEKKSLTWEDKKKIEETLEKQKELIEDVEKAIEKNKERMELNKEFKSQQNERLNEKEKAIQEMMEEMLNKEQEELMEKIQELMEKNRKEDLQKALKDLQTNEKDMRKQLERMKELYKELELEQKVQETKDKLNELAEEQKKLAEKTEKSDPKNADQQEKLNKEQDKLNEKFEDVKKDLKDIEKKNEALEKPRDIESPKEKQEEISKDMKESKQQLQQQQNKQASQKQKKAAKKMEEMSNELEEMMMAAQMKQQMEDYNTLRGILENLVQLSFDQEELIKRLKQIRQYNPAFIQVAQEQKDVKDDARIIEDSLFALSKRVVQIKNFINKEMGRVNDNLTTTLDDLDNRRIPPALTHQQMVMTGLNNLAVMLSDVLKNMQEQMKSAMPMMGCSNPNQSQNKPMNMQKMRQMQQQLGDQMKKMQQKSQQEGGKQPNSKELAETAQQQAAIRRELEKMRQQLEQEGKAKELGDLQKTTDIMDQVEKDLVNRRLSGQTIKRLQELEIRLLQHEKAEQEQEKDNKRTSNEGKKIKREMPPALEEYLKQKQKEQELLRTLPPDLNPYYQKKAREYFRLLDL
jgi:hypothetical protein